MVGRHRAILALVVTDKANESRANLQTVGTMFALNSSYLTLHHQHQPWQHSRSCKIYGIACGGSSYLSGRDKGFALVLPALGCSSLKSNNEFPVNTV